MSPVITTPICRTSTTSTKVGIWSSSELLAFSVPRKVRWSICRKLLGTRGYTTTYLRWTDVHAHAHSRTCTGTCLVLDWRPRVNELLLITISFTPIVSTDEIPDHAAWVESVARKGHNTILTIRFLGTICCPPAHIRLTACSSIDGAWVYPGKQPEQ
jgi:hypothetical protein